MRANRFLWVLAVIAGLSSATATAGSWTGWMNTLSADPSAGGTYMWGSGWGVPELKTVIVSGAGSGFTITDNILDLYPNYNCYADNPGNAYWRNNGGAGPRGNKWLEANTLVQSTVSAETTVFSGTVSTFTLAPEFKADAFIRVFDSRWNLVSYQLQPLTSAGNFTVSLDTVFYPGFNLQKGFQISGTNANPADMVANGSLRVITEPSGGGSILINVGSGTTRTQAQAGYASIPAAALVTKTGSGTVIFNAANPYSGPTNIEQGTLQVSSTAGLTASPVTIAAGGKLAITATGSTGLAGVTVSIGGTMALGGGQPQTVGVQTLSIGSTVPLTVDSAVMTNGYMNVYDLSGNYDPTVSSPWAVPELRASFTSGTSVTLAPCYVADSGTFWYTPSGQPGARRATRSWRRTSTGRPTAPMPAKRSRSAARCRVIPSSAVPATGR